MAKDKILVPKDKVLEIVQANPGIQFNDIGRKLGVEISWTIRSGPDFARALDSACQALRRKGLIHFDKSSRGWFSGA